MVQKNFKFHAGVKKCYFGIRMIQDGRALLVHPSRIPYRNWKNIFDLSSYESLERIKGKSRERAHVLKVRCSKITVWMKFTYLNWRYREYISGYVKMHGRRPESHVISFFKQMNSAIVRIRNVNFGPVKIYKIQGHIL